MIDIHKETGGAKELNVQVIEEDFWKHIPLDLKDKLKICKDLSDPLLRDYKTNYKIDHFGIVFKFSTLEERVIEFGKAMMTLAKKVEEQFKRTDEEVLVLSPRMFDLLKEGEYNRSLISFNWFVVVK
jgi:hypothetical protein